MINIPIGENFEALVRWLKTTFDKVFDVISAVIDFPIEVLANTLLLNETHFYASVLFGVLLALLTGFVCRRFAGGKGFALGFLGAAVLFGGMEMWRVPVLLSKVTPVMANELKGDFQALRDGLLDSAPEDFSEPTRVLEEVLETLPETEDEDSLLYEARDNASDGIRWIGRARSQEFDEVYDALAETRMAVDTASADLPDDLASDLRSLEVRYLSLTLVEESDRMIADLNEAAEEEEPQLRVDFINANTYRDVMDLLNASSAFYSDSGNQQLAELSEKAASGLRKLNPDHLNVLGPVLLTIILAMAAYLLAGRGIVVFTVIGFFLIWAMDLWSPTVDTLALVLSATLFALAVGIPVGILSARFEAVQRAIRPVLDFMQTMPAFVYLIPAVIFFGTGEVPGAIATLVFATPPAVRLTNLGIRQVPSEVVEAGQAFGATDLQLLFKAQLPIAMPTILAGVNQTIMLSLSMVVIAAMIGAGGLGAVVLSGITQMKLGLGFEGGIAVVILAIYLDRVTQALGAPKS